MSLSVEVHEYAQRNSSGLALIRPLPLHLLLVALLFPMVASGQVGDTLSGLVVRVSDDDTISVMRDGATVSAQQDVHQLPSSMVPHRQSRPKPSRVTPPGEPPFERCALLNRFNSMGR